MLPEIVCAVKCLKQMFHLFWLRCKTWWCIKLMFYLELKQERVCLIKSNYCGIWNKKHQAQAFNNWLLIFFFFFSHLKGGILKVRLYPSPIRLYSDPVCPACLFSCILSALSTINYKINICWKNPNNPATLLELCRF